MKIPLFAITVVLEVISQFNLLSQPRDVVLTLHQHGVYECNINLIFLTDTKKNKSVSEVRDVKNGEIAKFKVLKANLPGNFALMFEYTTKQGTNPYHSEKSIIINDQDLELWVNPVYCNNPDSTWFQQGERENTVYALFAKENGEKKEKLALLQQFLLNYDDSKSKFYKQGIEEYEIRRQAYNKWLRTRKEEDKTFFVSSLYQFHKIPQILFEGTEKEKLISLIDHYFDEFNFNDSLITETTQFNEWMNSYVNLYGKMATTVGLRDSLLSVAATTAIKKAKQGNPIIYGWMVDYFYRGFESSNIPEGMKVLDPYLNDPNCLTTKRVEIKRRLNGLKTLVKGSKAPEIILNDPNGGLFDLNKYETPSKYILLLFWSAGCSHCEETINLLYPWQIQSEIFNKLSIIAISLDETETEVKAWDQRIKKLVGWKHIRTLEGVNSKVASDYFVLSTPVMILLNSKTKEIISLPASFANLKSELY